MVMPFVRPVVTTTDRHESVWLDQEHVIVLNDDGLSNVIVSFCQTNGQISCIPLTKLPSEYYPCLLKINISQVSPLTINVDIVEIDKIEQKGMSVVKIINNWRGYELEKHPLKEKNH